MLTAFLDIWNGISKRFIGYGYPWLIRPITMTYEQRS